MLDQPSASEIKKIGVLCIIHFIYFWIQLKNLFTSFKFRFMRDIWGFPGGSDDKESVCNVGDTGSVPGSERSGEGNGYPL